MSFSYQLKTIRAKKSLSTKQACELFTPAISLITWQRWECGAREPKEAKQHIILKRLKEHKA